MIFRYGNANSLGFGRNSVLPPENNFPHLMKQSSIYQSLGNGDFPYPRDRKFSSPLGDGKLLQRW